MAERRNIIWPKLNQDNAERIRAALNVPKVERGPNAWPSKIVTAAIADWAAEIEINPNALDMKTVLAYEQLYANEVYVKKPWGQGKPPVFNAAFSPETQQRIDTIGHELDRLGMANVKAKSGFNRTAVVMLALDKYAKKLELMGTADGKA